MSNEDEHASANSEGSVEKDAGEVEPKVARLPRDPAPYVVTPREEPGPEAFPPAVIEREFQPITDVGPPTAGPEEYRRRSPEGDEKGEKSEE